MEGGKKAGFIQGGEGATRCRWRKFLQHDKCDLDATERSAQCTIKEAQLLVGNRTFYYPPVSVQSKCCFIAGMF